MTSSRDGAHETRTLRPLALPARAPGMGAQRDGRFVDCETTGLSAERDVLIELALLPLAYTLDGVVAEVLEDEIQAYRNDPGRALPEEVTHLTGLTDEDLCAEREGVGRPRAARGRVPPLFRALVSPARRSTASQHPGAARGPSRPPPPSGAPET